MMTPLIDIFLLIIFFLLTCTFASGEKEKELTIHLPATQGGTHGVEGMRWYFNVLESGAIVLQGRTVTLKEVDGMLEAEHERRDGTYLIVRAHENVPYRMVAKLMGLFSRHGFARVAFQTVDEKE